MTKEYYSVYCKQKLNVFESLAQHVFCLPPKVQSGHPDFDSLLWCQLDVPTGPTKQIVQSKLSYDESGLGKPIYCNDHTMASINKTKQGFLFGIHGKAANGRWLYPQTAGKDRFDEWYNDVPGVNKRIFLPLIFLEDRLVYQGKDDSYFDGKTKKNESSIVTIYDSNDPRFYKGSKGFFPLDDFTIENSGASADPLEFQTVWPKTSHLEVHTFSFTTAFHSVFTYFGGEVFKFRGDDDVYVFINEFLELDLGGRHSEWTGYILLDEMVHSKLIVNETYTIDLFHAERQRSKSNFAITSTLVAPLSIRDIGYTCFDWPDSDEAEFAFIGSLPAIQYSKNESLPLLDVTGSSQGKEDVGYLLLQRKLLLNKGFIIDVGVRISGTGSSGFSIILHNGEVANLPLTGRSLRNSEFHGVGVAKGEKSLGLTLDLCKNQRKPVVNPSTCEQEISLRTHRQSETVLARSAIVGKLADDKVHRLVLTYTAATQYLEVFIDGSLYLLQTKFAASDYFEAGPATVGISIFQDSIVPTERMGFENTKAQLHSFKVVVAEFRTSYLFSTVDVIVLSLIGAVLFFYLFVATGLELVATLRWLHASVSFIEDVTAIFLLVEKACELCPGTPSTHLFLIFLGVEFLFQFVPHIIRRSPGFRFIWYVGIEFLRLYLFLNLLRDTVNKDAADLFVVYVGIQIALVGLEAFNRKLYGTDHVKTERAKTILEPENFENDHSCRSTSVFRRILNDGAITLALNALRLISVFVYPTTSVFQEKWYQVLVAQNLWYQSVVIDSMVESMSDEDYMDAGSVWNTADRSQLLEEWKAWAKNNKTLAISSVGHMFLIHILSASLAVHHLMTNPSEIEVVFCWIMFLAIPYMAIYAYKLRKILRNTQKTKGSPKYIADEPPPGENIIATLHNNAKARSFVY